MRRFVSREVCCLPRERSNMEDDEWGRARDAGRRGTKSSIGRTIDFG
jgi:hypothetical protein